MKHFTKFAFVLLVISHASMAQAGTIDIFKTAQSADVTVAAPPAQGVGSVANPTSSAIGGERDLFVNKTSGGDDERIRARVNPVGATKLRIDADAEVTGSVYVTWDGVDANPDPFTGIDYNGLGGIDLTAGADAFEVIASFSDIGGLVRFSVFDNTANDALAFASATLNIPAAIPSDSNTTLMLPFTDFTGMTSALSNAGAILMEVQNTTGSWDVNILSVKTVPEPTTFALFGFGLLGMLGWRRKRA